MATKYSNAYGQNPSNLSQYIHKGATPARRGELCVRYIEFTGTLSQASADSLVLCDLVNGEKVIGFFNGRSGDPDAANDFTFNLGYTGALTAYASASTGMQATTKFELTEGDLINAAAVAIDGAQLILTAQAGAAEVSATHRFIVYSIVP